MMTGRTLFRNYKEYDQKEVEICGWVKSNRGSKKFGFLVINDGTFFEPIQVVYDQEMDNFDAISKLNVGTAVIVNGTVIVTPDAKQPFEIHAKSVEVEGECPSDYPLQKKRHTLEYLRSISHLRPRTNTFQAVFRVRSQIAYAIHKFFQERDFVYVHTPLITGQDCEGAGEMFQVTTMDLNKIAEEGKVDYEQDFFKKPVSLTVSGQLAGETFAQAFRNIYTFGPTFRAEDSNTTRHAAEFWMIEPEIAFADLEDNMILAEQMIKYIINYVMEHAQEELQFFNKFVDKGLLERLNHVVSSDFGRVTYTEAVKLLEEHNDEFEYKVSWGIDLQTEHERYLTEQIEESFLRCTKPIGQGFEINCDHLLLENRWIQKQIFKKVLEETAGKKKDLERRHVEDLLNLAENGTGKRISLPYNMTAEKNYQYIKVQKGNISDKQEMTGKILCEEVTDLTNIVENDCIKIIDYDRIETGVQLRCRKPGDFFTFGKDQKRKSLSRYFIDEKIPRQLREEIPLVADGSHIVWIVGRRISEYYKIKESTKRYLKLEFKREGDDSNGEYQSNDFRGRCKQTNRGDGSTDQ